MYDLFYARPSHSWSTTSVSGFGNLETMVLKEYDKLVNYYRYVNTNFTVLNDHVLVKALTALAYKPVFDPLSYMDSIRGQMDGFASVNGFCCTSSYGSVNLNGNFYNKKIKEVLIANNKPVDPKENWRDHRPVRILSHPFSNLNLTLPNGKVVNHQVTGYATFVINLCELGYMYQCWFSERGKKGEIGEFIYQEILTQMCLDHLNISLINLFFNEQNVVTSMPTQQHPVHLLNLDSQIYHTYGQLRNLLNRAQMSYYQLLDCVTLMRAKLSYYVSETNVNSRFCTWGLSAGMMPYYTWLLRYHHANPHETNRALNYRMNMHYNYLQTDRDLDRIIDLDSGKSNELFVGQLSKLQ